MKQIIPPAAPGVWSLSKIQLALSRPIPNVHIVEGEVAGRLRRMVAYRTLVLALDRYAPGWSWEVRNRTELQGLLWVTGRLTVVASDGNTYRDAIAPASCIPGEPLDSMALRSAAVKYGLGLGL